MLSNRRKLLRKNKYLFNLNVNKFNLKNCLETYGLGQFYRNFENFDCTKHKNYSKKPVTKETKFACDVCVVFFTTKNSLATHMLSKAHLRNCPAGSKEFKQAQIDNSKKHKRTMCEYETPFPSSLNRHVKLKHTQK